MTQTLILIEQPSDILTRLNLPSQEDPLFFSCNEELLEELQERGLPVLSVEKRKELSQTLFKGVDEFAIHLAENWYREPWIRPYQQYRSIDTAGIYERDMTYYLLWLAMNTLLIQYAIEKTSPRKIYYLLPQKPAVAQILDADERLAYRVVPFLHERRKYDFEEIPFAAVKTKKMEKGVSPPKTWLKSLLGRVIGTDFDRYHSSGGAPPGVLFSSDLKHVFELMKLFKEKPTPFFYARPNHGIRTFMAIRKWGFRFLKPPRQTTRPRPEVHLLEDRLRREEFSLEDFSSSLYHFGGIDFFPLLRQKWVEVFPAIHSEQRREIDAFSQFFDRQAIRLIVTDEDVCPFNKLLVQVARTRGIPSVVLQNGAMGQPKGFTPLSANFIFCWGENDKRRLLEWGVPEARIRVTGCSRYDPFFARKQSWSRSEGKARLSKPVVLFVGSPYHESYRPDFVRTHINRESHFRTIAVLGELMDAYPRFQFVYKFHPRDLHAEATQVYLRRQEKEGRISFEQKGPLEPLLFSAEYVLAQWSTACIEAILLEKPLLIVNFESDYDPLPFTKDGVAMKAKTEEEFKQHFKEMVEMDGQKLDEWKECMRRYAARLHKPNQGNASQEIFSELQALIS